ncbi:hypothetical protein BDV11DRAFT_200964 [Aspergillus similis]
MVRVESFETDEIPDYAILSHRWGDREISYEEIQNGAPGLHDKDGYKKITKCCELAASVGFDYVWIDTCCIVKKDGAQPGEDHELSKELASMFNYYRNSQVCYTYLADVSADEDPSAPNSAFRNSKWFKRGWTLQELVAPLYITFFDKNWIEIGTKSSLQKVIAEITGIPSAVLLTNASSQISVAERMEWMGVRETSVVEDWAYSLMGLLGVNISVEYGEREKAAERLKAKIAELANDSSTDPDRFDVSSWMVPEAPYRFYIRKRPVGNPSIIEGRNMEWTITDGKMEIELVFGGSGHSGTLMFKSQAGTMFAVTMGVHNYSVWCDIAADYDEDDIRKLVEEYWHGVRSDRRWNNMDRHFATLLHGESVLVAIRKGRRDGGRIYLIDILAGADFRLYRVGPGYNDLDK